jgi:hypothetical protein
MKFLAFPAVEGLRLGADARHSQGEDLALQPFGGVLAHHFDLGSHTRHVRGKP